MLLSNYKPRWASDFNEIKTQLIVVNQGLDISIEHVGSTSITHLMAKPIIDIDLIYSNQNDFEKIRENLACVGYSHVGDQGISGREVFKRKGAITKNNTLDSIRHHLYVCHESNPEFKRHLLFRDALRSNPQLREEYQQLKLKLAVKANQDKKLYADLKEKEAINFFESFFQIEKTNHEYS